MNHLQYYIFQALYSRQQLQFKPQHHWTVSVWYGPQTAWSCILPQTTMVNTCIFHKHSLLREQLQTLHRRTTKKTADTEDGITDMLLSICMSWLPFVHFVPGSEVSHKPSPVTLTWTLALLTSQPSFTATMVMNMEIAVNELNHKSYTRKWSLT